jgi:hypothetical protein
MPNVLGLPIASLASRLACGLITFSLAVTVPTADRADTVPIWRGILLDMYFEVPVADVK